MLGDRVGKAHHSVDAREKLLHQVALRQSGNTKASGSCWCPREACKRTGVGMGEGSTTGCEGFTAGERGACWLIAYTLYVRRRAAWASISARISSAGGIAERNLQLRVRLRPSAPLSNSGGLRVVFRSRLSCTVNFFVAGKRAAPSYPFHCCSGDRSCADHQVRYDGNRRNLPIDRSACCSVAAQGHHNNHPLTPPVHT